MDKSPPVDKDMWEAVIQISKMIYERTNHFIPESDIAAIIRRHTHAPQTKPTAPTEGRGENTSTGDQHER